MPFGLTIGTERAQAFQQAIEDELTRRGYSSEPDPTMAEYITIMVINNKSAAQIKTELEDLISTELDPTFISWLFEEAAKGASGPEATPASPPSAPAPETSSQAGPSSKEIPTFTSDSSSRKHSGPSRNGVYQQTISQVLPPSTTSAQKRTASARSPSPSHPNKSRRTDLPTGPRAMQKEGPSRSLLDRMGVPVSNRPGGANGHSKDEIQRRIDSVTGNAPDAGMMIPPGFPAIPPGMDMNAMAANMVNPLMLQEMMMNQMALMAQMASSMGMLNTNTGQFNMPGLPQNGVQGDPSMMQNAAGGFQGQGGHQGGNGGRGRGAPRGRGAGRGRGGPPTGAHNLSGSITSTSPETPVEQAPIVAPSPVTAATPTPAAVASSSNSAEATIAGSKPAQYAVPERPQSPTLCKFGTKCTNAHCRYSHPSPVATAESGVVLSNEHCENGRECKDKDCTKAHVSPAVLNPTSEFSIPASTVPPPRPHTTSTVPCRFGLACTRPGCSFSHPQRSSHTQPCRFGSACTKATCQFQHPPGRVLPSTFHRGLSTSGPIVNVPTPETGSMGAQTASPHKSVTFNNAPATAASMKEKLKEIEEKKSEMEKALREASANSGSGSGKKDDTNPVAITA